MKNIIKGQLPHTLNNSTYDNLGRHHQGKVRDNYYIDDK